MGLKANGKSRFVQADPSIGTGTTLHFRPQRSWFEAEMEWPHPDKYVPWDLFVKSVHNVEELCRRPLTHRPRIKDTINGHRF